MTVANIKLEECKPWAIEDGVLMRPDRRFFRVIGLENGSRHQLFIDQPEVGVLGFAITDVGSTRYILVQAKDEPGNEFLTQIAPTIQATKSNFENAHGGAGVPYLDFFTEPSSSRRVLNDSQSSEHGERFWKKQNRNIAIVANRRLTLAGPRYRWIAISELLQCLAIDFLVNTDSRSVLAATPWAELCGPSRIPFDGDSDFERLLSLSFHQPDVSDASSTVMEHLNEARREIRKSPVRIPLAPKRFGDVAEKEWVRYIHVSSESREVGEWSQPIYETRGLEKNILVLARRRGELVVILRLSEEQGLRTAVEWSTTTSNNNNIPEFVSGLLAVGEVKATLRQTEEGSRFFRSLAQFDLVDCDVEVDDVDLVNVGLHAVNLATFNHVLGTSQVTTNELRTAASLILRWI